MTNNTKTLCKIFGGSHLYGMNTPSSDIDYRGVFFHTDPAYILGTKRNDEYRKQNPDIQEDIVFKELNHFAYLLKQANSEALELLFAEKEFFTEHSSEWSSFQADKYRLVDSEKLYRCLLGYMQGEYRLAIGERKGTIGGKRYEQVLKYGFSPKNFCQLFRLSYVGQQFFLTDQFIVNMKKYADKSVYDFIMDVKTKPEKFTKEYLTKVYQEEESKLKETFINKKTTFVFDEKLINEKLLSVYIPYLKT